MAVNWVDISRPTDKQMRKRFTKSHLASGKKNRSPLNLFTPSSGVRKGNLTIASSIKAAKAKIELARSGLKVVRAKTIPSIGPSDSAKRPNHAEA